MPVVKSPKQLFNACPDNGLHYKGLRHKQGDEWIHHEMSDEQKLGESHQLLQITCKLPYIYVSFSTTCNELNSRLQKELRTQTLSSDAYHFHKESEHHSHVKSHTFELNTHNDSLVISSKTIAAFLNSIARCCQLDEALKTEIFKTLNLDQSPLKSSIEHQAQATTSLFGLGIFSLTKDICSGGDLSAATVFDPSYF